MHNQEDLSKLVQTFYQAFKDLDAEQMCSCYHDEVEFTDPAFGALKGERARNMWRMLIGSQKGKSFVVDYGQIEVKDGVGSAHWEAQYNFSQTGRDVHNKVDATLDFKDGKIIKHVDRFNLYAWSKQAMGMTGVLIGWTPFFKNKLNSQTNKMLDKFEAQSNK